MTIIKIVWREDPGGGGGGDSAYEKGEDARRKF